MSLGNTARIPACAFVCLALVAHAARADDETFERAYIDLMVPEAVGFSGDHRFDLTQNGDFVGTQTVRGGAFLGGGIGERTLLGFRHGVLLVDELYLGYGRLTGATLPWATQSQATRGELLVGAGWGFSLGPFFLYTATVVGAGYLGFDVQGPLGATGVTLPSTSSRSSSNSDSLGLTLSSWDLRAGQELGIRVQIAKYAAIFADGSFDYDRQWRVHAGVALGYHTPN